MRLLLPLLAASCLWLSCAVVPSTTPPGEVTAAPNYDHWFGCTTACGMYAPLARNCATFQKQEKRILSAYARHTKWHRAQLCSALRGWTIIVAANADQEGIYSLYHEKDANLEVYGLTVSAEKVVIVGMYDWYGSALSHEVGHVFEIEIDKATGGHWNWTPKGICKAINEASGLADDCANPLYNVADPNH